MTHDELLAKIKDFEADNELDASASMYALRAVVKLHEPIDKSRKENKIDLRCRECTDGFEPYPCPTIQAIEKELV